MTTETPKVDPHQARRPLFLGVDVGGTNTKIGLVDDFGRTVSATHVPTHEERGPEDALQRIAEACDSMAADCGIARSDLAAVGLGTPGTMDIPSGRILEPPNMPHWRHFPLRDRLREIGRLPVAFDNDANAAAFGEYWVGTGSRAMTHSMIMLTLGTGVGGGIIVDGSLVHGAHSFGSECGHIIVDSSATARPCVWGGGLGELEAYASASAVAERMREELRSGRESSVSARLATGEPLSTLLMNEEAERGDALCLEVILETARILGIAVVTLVHTIDPGLVVLGGAMNFGGHDSPVGRRFLARIREEFHRRAFHVVAETTTIEFASLGGDAGYIGAAGIARAEHQRGTLVVG